jgi:hypothetical protein
MLRNSVAIARRRAISGALWNPCLRACWLPLGAPGECPPCSRQRPFAMGDSRHGVPWRVRAPQHVGAGDMGHIGVLGTFSGSLTRA